MVPKDGPETASEPGDGGRAERPPASGGGDDSVVDLAQQPIVVAWTKFLAALFALAGVGMGLLAILAWDVVDESIWDGGLGGFTLLPPDMAPFWAIVVAVFLGAYLGRSLATDDTTTYLAAAISTFVGTVVLLVLSAFLTATAVDGLSVDFGDLIVVAAVSGIVVAAVGAGAVWIARSFAPDGAGSGVADADGVARPAD